MSVQMKREGSKLQVIAGNGKHKDDTLTGQYDPGTGKFRVSHTTSAGKVLSLEGSCIVQSGATMCEGHFTRGSQRIPVRITQGAASSKLNLDTGKIVEGVREDINRQFLESIRIR